MSGPGSEHASTRALLDASLSRARSVRDLAVAEVRLAAVSGLNMLLLVLLSAGALVISWALLVVCCLRVAAILGIPWAWTALALAGVHALLASYLWQMAVKRSSDLTLPELRKTLTKSTKAQEGWDARRASTSPDRQAATPAGSP